MAWSEPPFITFALLAFILLSLHIGHPRPYLLLAASLAFGLAISARYVGVTMLPPMILGLLLLGKRSLRYRMRDASIAVAVSCIPISAWVIRNIVIAETSTNRGLAFHPTGLIHVRALVKTMHTFVMPLSVSGWAMAITSVVITAAVLISISILIRKNYIRRNARSFTIVFPSLSIVFSLTYIFAVFLSITFFDAGTPMSERILLPVFIFLSIAAVTVAWSLSQALNNRIVWWVFVLFVFLSVTINSTVAVSTAVDIHRNGRGYTSRYWRNSETVARLASLDETEKIYTNGISFLRFVTQKEVVTVPVKIFNGTRRLNQDYEEQLQFMCGECREGNAIVVYLNRLEQWNLATSKDVESNCNLPVLSRCGDGVIYGSHQRTNDATLDEDPAIVHPGS